MRIAPRYIGWRTTRYTPVDTTRCPRSTWTRTSGDKKVLSVNERNRKSHHRTSSAPPATLTASGTRGVQRKVWARSSTIYFDHTVLGLPRRPRRLLINAGVDQ
jgi:hypothetical protein